MKRLLPVVAFALGNMLLATGASAAEDDRVTFSKDVAPIFFAHCVSCHRPGEIAPMSLLEHASARPWAKSIKKAVIEKIMPPWHADSSAMAYLNDRSISDEAIETIVRWVDQGALAGDERDLPPTPQFDSEWAIGKPDLIFEAKRDFRIPATTDEIEYQLIPLEVNLAEDLFVSEWQILPSEPSAMHHANMVRAPRSLDDASASNLIGSAVLQGGDYIGSYLPGARPFKYGEGTALRIPAGSSIALQVHYVGIGREVSDHIRLAVKFAEGRIDKLVRVMGTDTTAIDIPPGDGNWELQDEVKFLFDTQILSSGAHMHLRGKDYTMKAILPDGAESLITRVPNYDFNWQSNYQLAEPVLVPKGSRLHVTAHYDNSGENPYNPDATQRVRYGLWTDDEMLTCWAHAVLADEKLGYRIESGALVGKFPDAQAKGHPFMIQSFPRAMLPSSPSTDKAPEGD